MRCLRVFGAVTAVSSLAAFLSLSCANANGNLDLFGDAGRDGGMVPGNDATMHVPDTGTHDTGMDTTFGFDNFIPPTPDTGVDSTVPPGMDAGFDGGLVFFGNPGSTCTTLGAMQAQSCGRCGMQTSTCIVRPDGGVPFDAGIDATLDAAAPDSATVEAGHAETGSGDASPTDAAAHDAAPEASHADAAKDSGKDAGPALVWSEWGACTAELSPDAGCLPGTQMNALCGACGTQSFFCEPDCEYGATVCTGQIDGGCLPGTVDFTPTAACSGDGGFGGTQQTCTTTCTWDASAACVTPPTTLTVSTTVGGKLSTVVDFVATSEKPLVGLGFCPATLTASDLTPYAYVTLVNPSTATTATVSVWSTQVGTTQIDTAVGEYAVTPANNAALKNCQTALTDSCFDTSDPTSCLGSYGGLMLGDFSAVVIPAGGSVVIFLQDQFNDTADLGIVGLTVRTESFP
jgi:hypothetical protein